MWKKRFSIKMIIGSILAGFIYGLAGELIYKSMELPVPHIIVVMLYFTGMFLFIGIAVYFIGKSGKCYFGYHIWNFRELNEDEI